MHTYSTPTTTFCAFDFLMSEWVLMSFFLCLLQNKYKENGIRSLSQSLYSQLPETAETQLAKTVSEVQSEVRNAESFSKFLFLLPLQYHWPTMLTTGWIKTRPNQQLYSREESVSSLPACRNCINTEKENVLLRVVQHKNSRQTGNQV